MKSPEYIRGYVNGWKMASQAFFDGMEASASGVDGHRPAHASLAHAGDKPPRGRPRIHPKKPARRGRPPKKEAAKST